MTIENIIFDNKYIPYFKNHQKHLNYNEFLSFNTIGSRNERNTYFNKLEFYNKIDSNFNSFVREIKINIYSIFAFLKIKCNFYLFNQILSNILKTYKIITKISKFNHLKNRLNIVLMSIYYVCKLNYIFINLKELMNNYNISSRIKNILIKSYFLNNRDIYLKLKDNCFRIKFISNILIRYISLNKFYWFINQNWLVLKKTKDLVIVIVILKIFKNFKKNKTISNSYISKCLGINLSSSNNFLKNNKLLI